MGSITMSGFNNIDWNTVLNAVMQQESQPLTYMQSQRTAISSRSTAYGVLAGWVSSLESKVSDLASAATLGGRTVTSTDAAAASASGSSSAQVGTYDVVVSKLARAQVTATTTASAVTDPDTVVVANGGSIAINGKPVVLTGDTTLQGLCDAINSTDDVGVAATVIAADGKYQLVLTGTETGLAHAFTVTNTLAYPPDVPAESRLAFSGTNAMDAQDADLTVNRVRVTSATNTITGAIAGVTLTLYKESSSVVSVSEDSSNTKTRLHAFVDAYNSLASYLKSQSQTAKNGDTGSIGRDAMLRGMHSELNSAILGASVTGGALTNLTAIGIEFERDGTLTFNEAAFDDAAKTHFADVQSLLAGTGTTAGVFDSIKTTIAQYTSAGGLLLSAKTRLTEELAKLDDRIGAMQSRLEMRRLTLIKEYAAADSAIAALNSQASSLSGLIKV